MPCKEYEQLKYTYDMEMSTWAQFTYKENQHLRGVGDRKAKELARDARARANEKAKEMQWHRESCAECKRESGGATNPRERAMEDCEASWREEAHAFAVKEADDSRLTGVDRESFVRERERQRYMELEKLGAENIE